MAANSFVYDTRELKFVVKEWLDMDKVLGFEPYRDYYSKDDFDFFLDVAYKIATEVLAPVNEDSDTIGVRFEDGKVITPDSFKNAYQTCIEAGIGPMIADRKVEGHMPKSMYMPMMETLLASNSTLPLYWNLTAGAAELIQNYGTEEQMAMFFPKMYSGEWSGTMCLTEPQAGSDLALISSKASPTGKAGIYKIKGSKIFITSGDHDICENIIHLVLARIEGAKEGTSGLSLFIVPKYHINEDGSLGEWNDVTTVGIEHKMGQHGSATAALTFGDNNECIGYLIGDPPGEDGRGQGLAQMFNMMNEERLVTGLCATAVSSAAYQHSLAYARERVQGTSSTNPKGPRVTIVHHEDVKRMLLRQKACTEVCRAMIMKTLWYIDVSHESPDPDERAKAGLMVQINNPICKAYTTEMGWQLVGQAIQVYGGAGYIEEYPVAQLARDVKIYSIWEGTTFIQGIDMVGRKMRLQKGEAFKAWLKEIKDFIDELKGNKDFAAEWSMMSKAYAAYENILQMMQKQLGEGNAQVMPLYATRILQATSLLYGSLLIMQQGVLANEKLKELDENHYDRNFYLGKVASARFYVMNELTTIMSIEAALQGGDCTAAIIDEAILGTV